MSVTVHTQEEFDQAIADAFFLGKRVSQAITVSEQGCWIFPTTDRNGYGKIGFEGKTVLAHRAVWYVTRGRLDEMTALDHLCRNRACVNPAHLEPVTWAENTRRSRDGGCKHGHPWTPENTCYTPQGHRRCRECNRLACARRALRKASS